MSTLAVENLFNAVSASFAADGIHAQNLFGWRIPTQHPFGPRIAWVPGDPSNSAGLSTAPRGPGGLPVRALGMLRELCTVYITAQDPSDPENELVQYHIVRQLHDAWLRAVYHAAYGTFWIRSEGWETKRSERRHGATMRVVFELLAPILDRLPDPPLVDTGTQQDSTIDAVAAAAAVGTSVGANIRVSLLDVTESMVIASITPTPATDVQSRQNKGVPALTTAADGAMACAVAVQRTPSLGAFINAAVNGLLVTNVGNGSRIGCEVFFSNDGGLTARPWASISVGDTVHWNGSVAGYELSSNDIFDVWYEEGGTDNVDVQSPTNKNMAALTTSADGSLACLTPIQQAPSIGAFVSVAINGLLNTKVGDGTRVGCDVYFSGDAGVTARAWSAITAGDTVHWNGSVAGYQLTPSDEIDVWYEEG